MEVNPEIWAEVRQHWADLREAIEVHFDTGSMQRFDDAGVLVPSDRPMLESIVCDLYDKSPRFFYYLMATQNPASVRQSATGKRIIEIGSLTLLPLATGGSSENGRKQ